MARAKQQPDPDPEEPAAGRPRTRNSLRLECARSLVRIEQPVDPPASLQEPRARLGHDRPRRRGRQPAVPVAAGGGDDARRRQPPRRRAVRRRRRRVPRPGGAHAAARAGGSGSCCRSRSWPRATPPPVRAELDARAGIVWSWWSPRAACSTPRCSCARIVAEVGAPAATQRWTDVVTDALGVPAAPAARRPRARSGDRRRLTANFRDQYYGLVPAVVDDGGGPPLVTSGLIDPGALRRGAHGRSRSPAAASSARPSSWTGSRRRCGDGPPTCSCPRCSSPTRPGSSRPSSTPPARGCPACRRSPPARATGVDPWARRRRADVAGRLGVGVAPRRRHRARRRAAVRLGPRWLGRPAVAGAAISAPAVDAPAGPATSSRCGRAVARRLRRRTAATARSTGGSTDCRRAAGSRNIVTPDVTAERGGSAARLRAHDAPSVWLRSLVAPTLVLGRRGARRAADDGVGPADSGRRPRRASSSPGPAAARPATAPTARAASGRRGPACWAPGHARRTARRSTADEAYLTESIGDPDGPGRRRLHRGDAADRAHRRRGRRRSSPTSTSLRA